MSDQQTAAAMIELPRAEWDASRELTSYCFGDFGAFVDWVFARRADHVYALKDQGKLIAQVVDTRLPISARGKIVNACLISHVATEPAYRGKGVMARLLNDALRRQRDEGVLLASLYPFDYAYYERYGFAACGETTRITIPLRLLPQGKPVGTFDRTPAEAADAAALTECCNAAWAGYSGRVVRDSRLTADRLAEVATDSGYAVTLRAEHSTLALNGYMLYHFDARTVIVDEFVAMNQAARADLLTYLASHGSTHDTALIGVSAGDPLRYMLPARKGCVSLEPWGMFRVLDIAALTSGMKAGCGSVVLKIEDRLLPWNDGVWRFSSTNGLLDVERTDDPGAPVISVNELTRVLMGDVGAAQVPARMRADIESLLPQQDIWIQEQY